MSIPSLFSTQHGRVRMHFVQSLGKAGLWLADAPKATGIEFLPKMTRNSAGQIEANVTQSSAINTLEASGYKKLFRRMVR